MPFGLIDFVILDRYSEASTNVEESNLVSYSISTQYE